MRVGDDKSGARYRGRSGLPIKALLLSKDFVGKTKKSLTANVAPSTSGASDLRSLSANTAELLGDSLKALKSMERLGFDPILVALKELAERVEELQRTVDGIEAKGGQTGFLLKDPLAQIEAAILEFKSSFTAKLFAALDGETGEDEAGLAFDRIQMVKGTGTTSQSSSVRNEDDPGIGRGDDRATQDYRIIAISHITIPSIIGDIRQSIKELTLPKEVFGLAEGRTFLANFSVVIANLKSALTNLDMDYDKLSLDVAIADLVAALQSNDPEEVSRAVDRMGMILNVIEDTAISSLPINVLSQEEQLFQQLQDSLGSAERDLNAVLVSALT